MGAAPRNTTTGRLPDHEAAICRALWAAPQLAGVPGDRVSAVVHSHGHDLEVTVVLPTGLDATLGPVVADRAVRAVRSFDRSADKIEVSVTTSP